VPVLTDYLSRRGEYLVLILVVVLSVTLMLLSSTEKDLMARAMNDTAMTPVQIVLSQGRGFLGLRAENDSLRTVLARMAVSVSRLQEDRRENDRLRSMLDFREHNQLGLVATRVIAREASRPGREWKIDKGSQDGIRKNLAVVTVDGLMGKVTAVGPRSAFVRPLIARNCRVSAKISRTRTDAIVEWSNDLGLHLTFLPFRAEVEPGDEIISSGLGGVFPKGLLIGKVSQVETLPKDGSLRVLVDPAVDFSSIDGIFVVKEVWTNFFNDTATTEIYTVGTIVLPLAQEERS
jgi:rod shape-determining protein MreC